MSFELIQKELIIRPARPEDAEAICRLHVTSIRVLCAADYPPDQIEAWAGPKRAADYVRGLEAGEAMYVAKVRGEILGFGCRYGDELRGLYIGPTATGRGVGTSLLKRIEDDAVAAGIHLLQLHSTLTAAAFYEKRGYSRGEPVARVMRGVAIPCVPMKKHLGEQNSPSSKEI